MTSESSGEGYQVWEHVTALDGVGAVVAYWLRALWLTASTAT